MFRDVAKNDKLRSEEALPFRSVAGEGGRATTSIRSMSSRKMRYRSRPPCFGVDPLVGSDQTAIRNSIAESGTLGTVGRRPARTFLSETRP